MVWDERMQEGKEFQIVGAPMRNERKSEDRLMSGKCILAEEDDGMYGQEHKD